MGVVVKEIFTQGLEPEYINPEVPCCKSEGECVCACVCVCVRVSERGGYTIDIMSLHLYLLALPRLSFVGYLTSSSQDLYVKE